MDEPTHLSLRSKMNDAKIKIKALVLYHIFVK